MKSWDISNGLSQNTVTALEEDDLGRIWIGTPNQCQYYNGYALNALPEIENRVLNIYSKDSFVYCLTIESLTRINIFDFNQKRVIFEERDFYRSLMIDQGVLLVSPSRKDTLLYNSELQKINHRQTNWPQEFPEGFQTLHFKDYTIRYGNDGAYALKNNEADTITTSLSFDAKVHDENTLYIASHNGIIRLVEENGKLNQNTFFQGENIQRILFDKNGNLWIGTTEHGLYLVHRNSLHLDFYDLKLPDGSPIACWSLFEYDNDVFVCTSNGIYSLSDDTATKGIEKDTRGMSLNAAIETPDFILLGTAKNGILKYQNGQVSTVYSNPEAPLSNVILQIIPNEEGYLASSKKSFIQLSPGGEVLYTKEFHPMESAYPMFTSEVDNGYITASTIDVTFLDKELKVARRLDRNDTRVYCMTEEFRDTLWVASMDGGLFRIQDDSLVQINFPEHNLFTVKNVDNSSLWISAFTEIYNYNNGIARPYGIENGFPLREYNQMGVFSNVSNRVYFSGVGGVIGFNPSEVNQFPTLPNVHVIRKNGNKGTDSLIYFNYDESRVELEIEPIILTDKNMFELKYATTKSKWALLEGPENLNIPLPYGNFTFHLKIKNKVTGEERIQNLYFYRQLPFWKTLWFKIIAIVFSIILILGIYGLIRLRQARKKIKQIETDRKIEQERLRISGELHDNIGARLTHIISSLDIEMYDKASNSGNIETINKFARETMTQLRETIWAVSNKAIFLSEFAAKVEQYVLQINQLTHEDVSIENNLEVDFQMTPVETINFYRIIQEAVNNALKYAEADKIVIQMTQTHEQIHICIRDNGSGFDFHKAKSLGSGLSGMQLRAKEADALLTINPSENGTEITLTFYQRK